MSELRTDSREWVHRIMGSLDRMLVGIENLAVGNRPVLGGERYLTDKEVSAQLKLSRRTLQDYRNEGRISYYQLGGKILYRESDIEKMLQENYREAYMSGIYVFTPIKASLSGCAHVAQPLCLYDVRLYIFRHGDDNDRLIALDSVEYVTNPPLLGYQNTLFYQIFYIACCCIR